VRSVGGTYVITDEQLFRFSVLRAADPIPDDAPAIRVEGMAEPEGDRWAGVADEAVRLIRARGEELTTGDLAEALNLLDPMERDEAVELRNLASNRFVAQLRELNDIGPGHDLRNASDYLTAAVLMRELTTLDPTIPVAQWITQHPIVVIPGIVPGAAWLPVQAMVREPAVCDHYVVKHTLLGYAEGEIEDIKNYLKGETKKHELRHLTVDEEEVVSETEQETTRTEETATQRRNEMSAVTQAEAQSQVGVNAGVKTDGQYGPTRVSTDVGFQYSSSSKESRQTASEFSSDVLERSAETVRKRELKRVTRRHRSEVEQTQLHRVDNTAGAGHTVGIYRWVDSVWEATTYAVGKRLVLEFLLPEPGRPVLQARQAPVTPSEPLPPELPTDLFATLTDAKAAELAAAYGVDGIAPEPLAYQVVGVPFSSDSTKPNGERILTMSVKDAKVPEGYVGSRVFVMVTAMDRTDTNVASNVVVDVPGGRPENVFDALPNPWVFAGTPQQWRPNPDLRSILVRTDGPFGPGATVPVSVYAEDVRSFTGYVEIQCDRTAEALGKWKLDTIQKLAAGYQARLREAKAAQAAEGYLASERPAPRVDLDALCRQGCIAAMLGSYPDASADHDPAGWPLKGKVTGARARMVEFMEQAFEWGNLQYVAYPFYWADKKTRWGPLMEFDDPDPFTREFLRSGAVRVVVPVRLDMTPAVLFFLQTRIPWFGGPAPTPGTPGYRAIAEEIRQARTKEAEGEVVDTFRYTLPTSLTILQEDGLLPPLPPE
jgi:hypothetical protein